MAGDASEQLRNIRTFPQLVCYLRDEMAWPIATDDFEELTFDYTPEELGIDSASAAKIQEIKRLRPLVANQPWGIFFVKFEPKRLPVGALRRILSRVAQKKRASANAAERAAWAVDDLLFVSNYGEGEERQITFAHFSHDAGSGLPSLRVLGWDNLDTRLHLDQVAKELTDKLAWPHNESDTEAWRETWSAAFTLRHREVITTSKALAEELAALARVIRQRINTVLAIESENGPVTRLMKAFREALVHDLEPDDFADMYAQTVAYGLLSARVASPQGKADEGDFTQLPITSPFLKELMETFLHVGRGKSGREGGAELDFDELGVSEVVELLNDANMEAVVLDFGDRNPQEDPVIHFYELFLKEYDAKKRMQRGVFYTPRPVVSYIVRSIDELLRSEFGLEDGLADTTTWGQLAERHENLEIPRGISPEKPFVQVLDPACGTGTFLVEVIDLIHVTLVAKWRAQGCDEPEIDALWNEYVSTFLLPRLHGYELLMAPYAIAHLKIGLKLHETGYRLASGERVCIYLTNALEPAHDFSGRFEFAVAALAHEARAVSAVKREQHFTLVIGNPPYSGVSSNNSEDAIRLVDAYKIVDGERLDERKLWLQDDYVKFLRFGQMAVEHSSLGILAYVTNHGYLDNPTFRGMRQSLLHSFQRRQAIDLHGNAKKKESSPDGGPDENVFDIQQGVAVGLFVRSSTVTSADTAFIHGDLYGVREAKYEALLSATVRSLPTVQLHPSSPLYLFVERDETHRREFESMPLLSEVTHVHSVGVVTARDTLTIGFLPEEIWDRVQRFSSLDEHEARREFQLRNDVRDWKVALAQDDLRSAPLSKARIRPILYRPLDTRFTYYTGKNKGFIGQPAAAIMHHMIGRDNLGLMTTRKVEVGTFAHAFCAQTMTESHSVSLKEVNYLFPLWLYRDDDALTFTEERRLNFTPPFLNALAETLGVRRSGPHGLPEGIAPEELLDYIYAVLHSPTYRSRYADLLKTDFPRIPLPTRVELFHSLSRFGGELVALHLLKAPVLDCPIATYSGLAKPQVMRVGWSDDTVWIDAGAGTRGGPIMPGSMGFLGVSEDVWRFQIGGYQVCEKWLKDRKGRKLSDDDIAHYHKVVVAVSETIRLMQEIDEVIEAHGGWPGAFQTTEAKS